MEVQHGSRERLGKGGATLELKALRKSYGAFEAVKGVDLTVQPGEFLTFLGPSGSGKTTTLNIIAGFDSPSAGQVLLDGRSLSSVPPFRRGIGMVFQNYALFPHMKVSENIAFPLSVRGVDRESIRTRVADALSMVRLEGLDERYPAQLSGGQQQRVALARALVFNPSLVLMDEPLGALDKKLRDHMQMEITRLHRSLGVTIIYVTHDQGEALTMSSRVGVFQDGTLVQVARPDEVYRSPSTLFVSDFVGENNHLDGVLELRDASGDTIRTAGAVALRAQSGAASPGDKVRVTLRPEDIGVIAPGDADQPQHDNRVSATIVERIYFGDHQRLLARMGSGPVLMAKVAPSTTVVPGDVVTLTWPASACRAFRLQ